MRCACGCGQETPLWTKTDRLEGAVKGEPRRWIPGHYHNRDPERQVRRFIGPADERGCWPWTGRVSRRGYGQFTFGGKVHQAHRFTYELFVGPVPEGLELDHDCRTPPCVNPEHLEPVTHAENMARSAPAQKTHCKHGHEFTPENTYRQWTGGRGCITCRRRDGRERARRKRAEAKRTVAA